MSEETQQERQRRLARERKRRQRERQSSSEAAAARAADTLRRKLRLSQENEYEREIRRRNESMRKRMQRLRASQGELLERRRIERERIAERRGRLSQEEIEERRRIERERIAFKRRNSSQEEIEERRRIERERIAERRDNETDEAALQRRQKNAENMRRLRAGTKMTRNASATVSSVNSSSQQDSLSPTTAAKFRKRPGSQVENRCFENGEQKAMTQTLQTPLPTCTQMQVQQPAQTAPRQVQVLATPVQDAVAKPKPVEKPQPREKRLLAIANHQRNVMSSLASLWKSGKLCDASIGNGSSTVKVHKLVLMAMCPKLLPVFNMDMISPKFLQVNFPKEVSKEALNAFAEYMYNGILDLDHDILEQLKIIAKRLDMKEFEQLCDSHLPKHMHQPTSAAASFTNIPLIKMTMPVTAVTSSLASLDSTSSTSAQSSTSIITQAIDIKQEISEVKKEAVAMFSQESEVALPASKESGNGAGFVISPSIKIEPVGPEDDKYGHLSDSSSNQAFTSTTSSFSSSSIAAGATASTSIASAPASSTEFSIPFSDTTDVKSTRLKVGHSYEAPFVSDLYPVSNIIETVGSQSSSMNKNSFKPLSQTSDSQPSVDLAMTSNSNNAVYPVRLFTAKGDNLPLLTTHSSDAMTVNSFTPSEKT